MQQRRTVDKFELIQSLNLVNNLCMFPASVILHAAQLELQFEDRSAQFVVSPMHAAIIMHFEDQTRYTQLLLHLTLLCHSIR